VIGKRDFQEGSLLVDFFSLQQGKFTAVVQGGRSSKKNWGGNFEMLSRLELVKTIPRNASALAKIVRVESALKLDMQSVEKFYLAAFVCEVIGLLLQEKQSVGRIFQLLEESFAFLQSSAVHSFPSIFLAKALTHLGFVPRFSHCTGCGKKFTSGACWESSGDILCNSCSQARPNLELADLKVLNFFQNAAMADCCRVKLAKQDGERIFNLLRKQLQNHATRKLHTLAFLPPD